MKNRLKYNKNILGKLTSFVIIIILAINAAVPAIALTAADITVQVGNMGIPGLAVSASGNTVTVSRLYIERAMPTQSKPGPKLAVVAGTVIVILCILGKTSTYPVV